MSLNYDYESHLEDRPVHKISVYTDKDGFVLIGFDAEKAVYSILKVRKSSSSTYNSISLKSILKEERQIMTRAQILAFLKAKKDQIKFSCRAYAILGFIKLLQGYYMLLVTEAEPVAEIGNHKIYKVNLVKYIPLFDHSSLNNYNGTENKYLQYLKSFDLSTGFYFSDTYDITNTFQTNVVSLINDQKFSSTQQKPYIGSPSTGISTHNVYFQWNHNIIKDFNDILENKRWVISFIYGYIEQIKIQKLLFMYQIILISRRACHHAGTRYLTRGLNCLGFVGNFVETEQIVIDLNNGALGNSVCSSFVQVRGSAPIYWFQETKVVTPKPPIHVNQSADIYFEATKKHFADLYSLYGPNIFALNLVKKKEGTKREQYLTEAFQQSIDYINRTVPDNIKIIYYHQDMKALLKKDKEEFLNITNSFGLVCLSKIGFFCAKMFKDNKRPVPLTFQTGAIRSNCVDCLDRTNTFQQLIGEAALSLQIARTKEYSNKENFAESSLDDKVLKHFRDMYGRMGDIISLQYGGSVAHKTDFGYRNTAKQIEFFTSLKRYYSNTFTDQYKQNAINLFLGIHKPNLNQPLIWDTTAPIIWAPDFKVLGQLVDSHNWWERPLESFQSSIDILDDPTAFNRVLSQSPVVKLDPKNSYFESIQEDLNSVNFSQSRKNSMMNNNANAFQYQRFNSASKPSKPMFTFPERNFEVNSEISKNVNYMSETDKLTNSVANPLPSSPSDAKSSFLWIRKDISDDARSIAPNDERVPSQTFDFGNTRKKLFYDMKDIEIQMKSKCSSMEGFEIDQSVKFMSKKIKRHHNHVLIVDEKYDNIDNNIRRVDRRSDNDQKQSSNHNDRPIPYPEDQNAFKKYCSFHKQNTDYMFDDQKMKSELIEDMKLGFDFEELKQEFEDCLAVQDGKFKTEAFSDNTLDYLLTSPIKDIQEQSSRTSLDGGTNAKIMGLKRFRTTNDENNFKGKTMDNFGFLKTILTGIYPNLQRPNIMKA